MFIPIQAVPYLRLFKRFFSSAGSLEAVAYRQDVLCPEENATLSPAVFLPGQLDRIIDYKITNSSVVRTKESEIAAATETTVTRAPAIAYHIKNAVLVDGSIYVGYFKHPIAKESLFNSATHEPYHIKTCALASTYLGTRFFGHWLVDDCSKYLLAEEYGTPLCLRMSPYGHQQKYQTFFDQDWTPTDRAYIDHLVVFQDFSQNSFKRKRYEILRDRIKAHFPQKRGSKLVYLKRGITGVPRIIQNEDEIIDSLVKRGFVVADIETDSLDYIIEALSNAKIVVSVEGSHIAHCTFASPENSALLVLQPPDQFSAVHRDWLGCFGIRFGFVVGDVASDGYHFPLPDILRTVDLLLNSLET